MRKNIKILQILNILTLAGIIVVNFLANFLPINGQTTGAVSNQYENLFTPAGYAFSIWSVIYLGLIAFVLYQSQGLFGGHNRQKPVASDIGLAFFINGIANIAWIYAWHYMQFNLTIILMAVILLSLIDINQRLYRAIPGKTSKGHFWWVKVPFGLYLGWICVATIANTAVFLTYLGWTGFGVAEGTWTIIALLLGGFVGLWLLARLRLVSAALAITWGVAGVLVNLWTKGASAYIQFTAILVIVLLAIGIARALRRKKSSPVRL